MFVKMCMAKECVMNGAKNCDKCGFDKETAAKRIEAWRREQTETAPERPDVSIKLSASLGAATERLRYAEERLAEEERNDEYYAVRYWAAYRDGVKGVVAALEKLGGGGQDV